MPPRGDDTADAGRGLYTRFLVLALGTVAALLLLGYLPTVRLGGHAAIPAMLAGCGIGLVASLVGTVPFLLTRDRSPVGGVSVVMGAIALRLAAAVVLTVAAALSGLFAKMPLLIWVALSHAGLLVADTLYARAEIRRSAPPG